MSASPFWDGGLPPSEQDLISRIATLVEGDIVEVLMRSGARIVAPVVFDPTYSTRKYIWLHEGVSRIDLCDRYGSTAEMVVDVRVIAPAPKFRVGQVVRSVDDERSLYVVDRLDWDDEWIAEWTNILDPEDTGSNKHTAFTEYLIGGERVFLTNLDPNGRP